jgi:hypothetical protein
LTQARQSEADYERARAQLLDRIDRASTQREAEQLRDALDQLDAGITEWWPTLYPPTGYERERSQPCARCGFPISTSAARAQYGRCQDCLALSRPTF